MKKAILDRLDIPAFYASELPGISFNGTDTAKTKCCFHEDIVPSLSVNQKTGAWVCFAGCGKGSLFDFYMKRYSLNFSESMVILAEKAGLINSKAPERKVMALYDYRDASGKLIFQAVRYEPKGFSQRRPDPNKQGKWIYNLQGIELIPYNLPEILKAEAVFLVEGEKDSESLKALGLVSSCNAGGAGKWKVEYNDHFKGKRVYILPDNDKPGRDHALQVAKGLQGIAASVKVIELPGLPEKGDVSDWIQAGGTKENLLKLVNEASEFILIKQNDSGKMALTKLSDLFKEPDENIAWLLQGILPTGGFSVLASKPKTGKSTISRNLALSVATGEEFLGLPVKQGAVIYLSLEEKRSEVKKHFQDMGAEGEEPIFIFSGSAPADAIAQIRQVTAEIKPALIIIDDLVKSQKPVTV